MWVDKGNGGKPRKTFWLNIWVFCGVFFVDVFCFVVFDCLGFFKEGKQMAIWSFSECCKLFQNWKSVHKPQTKWFQNKRCPIAMLARYLCTGQVDLSMYCVTCISQLGCLEMSMWLITQPHDKWVHSVCVSEYKQCVCCVSKKTL